MAGNNDILARAGEIKAAISVCTSVHGEDVCRDKCAYYRGPNMEDCIPFMGADVVALIEALEAADPVHAAGGCYCRECQFCEEADWDGEILYGCTSPKGMSDPAPDGFCSHGKRREEDPQC